MPSWRKSSTACLEDKAELVRIAQVYEEELVAQRISADDIRYISENIVPVLRQLAESATSGTGATATPEEVIDLIRPLLSVETVTVLQLIGFNFRKGVGEPLTELVSKLISSKSPPDPRAALEPQKLALARETSYLEALRDPEARARLEAAAE